MVALRHGLLDADPAVPDLLGQLDHDHRVSSFGKWRPGHDRGGLPRPHHDLGHCPGVDRGDHLEQGGSGSGVGGAHGIAVHHGLPEGRHVHVREDPVGEHESDRPVERDLGPTRIRSLTNDGGNGVFKGDQLRRVHGREDTDRGFQGGEKALIRRSPGSRWRSCRQVGTSLALL